jgi:microcystin-dependent protein
VSDPFIGEIRATGFNFAPQGWAMCNGALLPILQNTALFSILGTSYGGDGRTTFALPDLQGRFPVHANNGSGAIGVSTVDVGESGGAAVVTIDNSTMPTHTHTPQAVSGGGSTNSPAGAVWAQAHFGRSVEELYATTGGTAPMSASALASTGSSQPHNNMPPFLALNFIVALQGIFPARS